MQAATSLIKAHRTHGHLAARLDPLGSEPEGDPALDPEPLGLTPRDHGSRSRPRSCARTCPGATLADALPHLRETYCGTIAYEIEHIASHRQRMWLREKIESGAFRAPLSDEEKRKLLRRLTQVDSLERFMHKAYLGQKQFSIEGLDMTVPMLDEMIQLSAAQGAREVVLGMAHRGRLNVLAHNLGRAYETIFREFEGASSIEAVTTIPQGGTGDVKYHHGAQGTYRLRRRQLDHRAAGVQPEPPRVRRAGRRGRHARGPDHRARARTRTWTPTPRSRSSCTATPRFPGQGVVSETLNLQALDGYTVGGTLHLIQNNQVGFTTDPDDSRSTRWASDLAKGFDVPIIHVNADDVEACVSAVRLAFAFRQEFGHDVMIDLIGYRRFGHNETDEPAYTQPEMAAMIKSKTPVRELFAAQLVEQGVMTPGGDRRARDQEIWDTLARRHRELKEELAEAGAEQPTGGYELDRSASPEVKTAVSTPTPAGAQRRAAAGAGGLHRPSEADQAARAPARGGRPRRRDRLGAGRGARVRVAADRGHAGPPDRPGRRARHVLAAPPRAARRQDRPADLADPVAARARRRRWSCTTRRCREIACLGFEYGYSMEAPETLVLWEAQFGDFVNSAQVIIDQFIVSALSKWGQTTRLTLLLPHGYEGSGPEHSSARLERFLILAAEGNIRVANLTTPAQYFHLLRRQARVAKQRPLVIMTPKSLLRLPQATSRIEHLSESRFFPVLSEPRIDEEKVTRLVLCTGKIYYDLKGHATRENNEGVAISRVELLYPFPQQQILDEVARYPNLREVVWAQEEPRNMGARAHMSPRLLHILPQALEFGYVGRPERASPGEGYPAAHTVEQNRIIRTALDLGRRCR